MEVTKDILCAVMRVRLGKCHRIHIKGTNNKTYNTIDFTIMFVDKNSEDKQWYASFNWGKQAVSYYGWGSDVMTAMSNAYCQNCGEHIVSSDWEFAVNSNDGGNEDG